MSPGDSVLDFGATQGFAAPMVALDDKYNRTWRLTNANNFVNRVNKISQQKNPFQLKYITMQPKKKQSALN